MRIDVSKNVDIYGGHAEAEAFLEVLEKEYIKLFQELEDKFVPDASVELSIRSRITNEDGGKPRFIVSAVVRNPNTRAMAIDRVWAPNGPKNAYTLSNEYFALNKQFQSFGIADKVNRIGAKVLEGLKGSIVKVHANIDVGGYTWLRKGFWPKKGKADLKKAIWEAGTHHDYSDLWDEWDSLTEKEARALVLTKDFGKYKPLFLGTDWFGEADLSDEQVRAAFTGESPTAVAATASLTAATVNDQVFDYITRHQIYLQRYAGEVRNKMLATLDESEQAIASMIRDTQFGGSKKALTSRDMARLNALLNSIVKIRERAWGPANDYLFKQIQDLVYQEPIFLDDAMKRIIPVEISTVLPSPEQLKTIATSKPVQGKTLKDWAKKLKADDIKRISSSIRSGVVLGQSLGDIAKSVVGTRALKGKDGITEVTRRELEAVVRTSIQDLAAASRKEFMAELDFVEKELFVATLDARTTPICRALDGNVYPAGEGPEPTLHFGCRSTRVPLLDGEVLGVRPFKPTTEKQLLREYAEANGLPVVKKRADLPRGTKGSFDQFSRQRIRAMTGTVPAKTTYQEWLKRQPVWFQEETLGKTKAKLFREGGLTLDKFVNRNGDELTLKEIAAKHKKAFKEAGLELADYTN